MIKKLDQSSILNICVNQVIIDLATCVKELVENSLDAGSTKIEVYLKEYGKEGVEVVDNGIGIGIANLETIAQKGATSKLREFQDLENLDTFGFRGEALNAISVLSQLTITTRTENEEIGHRYQFNQDNTVKSKNLVPRERGTTIGLSDLFGSIPVRKQEFNKNIISQYNKLVNLMTEYALISVNCQICLINQTAKKGREMIINSGNPMKNMLQKASQVFSKKIADMLVELKFEFGEDSRVVEGYVLNRQTSGSLQDSKTIQKNMAYLFANTRPINPLKKMNSIFSDTYKKYNASARYIYILHMQIKKDAIDFNVSPDKRDVFIKYENEFYTALRDNLTQLFEKLNSIQKVLMPVTVSNKKINAYFSDGNEDGGEEEQSMHSNISNKRQSNEKKNSLPIDQNLQIKQGKLSFQKLAMEKSNFGDNDSGEKDYYFSKSKLEDQLLASVSSSAKSSLRSKSMMSKDGVLDEDKGRNSAKKSSKMFDEGEDDYDYESSNIKNKARSQLNVQTSEIFKNKSITQHSDYFNLASERKKAYQEQLELEKQETSITSQSGQSFKVKVWGAPTPETPVEKKQEKESDNLSYFNDQLKSYRSSKQQLDEQFNSQKSDSSASFKLKEYTLPISSQDQKNKSESNSKQQHTHSGCCVHEEDEGDDEDVNTQDQKRQISSKKDEINSSFTSKQGKETKQLNPSSSNIKGVQVFEYQPKDNNLLKKDIENNSVNSQEQLKVLNDEGESSEEYMKSSELKSFKIKVKADDEIEELADDFEDQQTLQENQDFRKEKFVELQIIGQFNKAFIIAYWVEKNEIFLIDQHASDEKTNYERLLKENVFQGQRLVKPIELSLTSQEADTLENHREIFKKNGFSFQVKYDQENGEANLFINQLPSSKHVLFDINDFDEIFQNINNEETDIEVFRPKKIKRILASKACRSSIMIGSALNNSQMKQILSNLSNLQSPWNCPHGRPTMVKIPPMNHLTQQVQVKKVYDL